MFRRGGALAAAIAIGVATTGWRVAAQGVEPSPEATPPAPAAPQPSDLEEAKELFRRGVVLQKAGDCERAVVFFLRSRALVASAPNTLNAAVCLTGLGRYDEALELMETLLTELRAELTEAERAWLGPEMARLRGLVGGLDVAGESDTEVVIDGRLRGRLPLVAPIRVLPGAREVQLFKSGFRPQSVEIEIEAGKTETLKARLEPLTIAGRLAVAGPPGAEVVVDGAPVGTVPWEGVIVPGRHVVQLRHGDAGSSPAEVVVVTGQTVRHEPVLTPLGAELRLRAEPREATLSIDGVEVATGRWTGRLPVGDHLLEATAEGHVSHRERLRVAIEDAPREHLVTLAIDRDHPRWAGGREGRIHVELFGGPALAASLGSDAERSCDRVPCDRDLAVGYLAGARAGYELPFGLAFEVVGGYAAIERRLSRRIRDGFSIRDPDAEITTDYALDSRLVISGGFVGGGLGIRQPLVGPLELGAHLAVGAWFTASGDAIGGRVTAGTTSDEVGVVGAEARQRAVDLFVAPELRLRARFGDLGVGLGLQAAVLTLGGPTGALGDVIPRSPCDPDDAPAAASCAPGEPIVAGERAYGPFVLFVPSASLGYLF